MGCAPFRSTGSFMQSFVTSSLSGRRGTGFDCKLHHHVSVNHRNTAKIPHEVSGHSAHDGEEKEDGV